MPKLQLRLPKAAQTLKDASEPVKAPPLRTAAKTARAALVSGGTLTMREKAPKTQATVPPVIEATVGNGKPKKLVVTMRKTPSSVAGHVNGAPKKDETQPLSAAVTPPLAAAPARKRATRLRGRVEAKKFLPRVQRVASLRAVRAIGYLEQIENRAVETARMPKDTKFPMSILEMKALNEAIRIMQVKLKLEQADIQAQKEAKIAKV